MRLRMRLVLMVAIGVLPALVGLTYDQKYGYSRDEFLAMRTVDIRPPEDVPRPLEWLGSPRMGGGPSSQWRHRLKSGEVIDVEIRSHELSLNGRAARFPSVSSRSAGSPVTAARRSRTA